MFYVKRGKSPGKKKNGNLIEFQLFCNIPPGRMREKEVFRLVRLTVPSCRKTPGKRSSALPGKSQKKE